MKKWIVILAIVWCLGVSFSSVVGMIVPMSVQPLCVGTTLYVGGEGPGNYSHIQDAIDNASNGDTIFVFNGTYLENLRIGSIAQPKQIHLVGESRDATVIEGVAGGDIVVSLMSNEVILEGFTIQGNVSGQDGVVVSELYKDIVIEHNQITGCAYAVWLRMTTERIVLFDNVINNNEAAGIRLQKSLRNDILENTLEGNGDWGILLESLSTQNNISGNQINDNYGGVKLMGGSSQNTLFGNTITTNDLEGIRIEGLSTSNTIHHSILTQNFGGITLSNSGQNIIEENTFQENSMEGLLIETSNSNIIGRNNFIDNHRQAAFKMSSRNSWDGNYWDNWVGFQLSMPLFQKFPKVIGGVLRVNFDWHPALEPYTV